MLNKFLAVTSHHPKKILDALRGALFWQFYNVIISSLWQQDQQDCYGYKRLPYPA